MAQVIEASDSVDLGTARPVDLMYIPLDQIELGTDRREKSFDKKDERVQNFIDSVARMGILQPIGVRKIGEDRYELVFGQKRFWAYKLLGHTIIPAKVAEEREVSDADWLEAYCQDCRECLQDPSAFDRAALL